MSTIIYNKYASHFKSKTLSLWCKFILKNTQNKLELFVTTMGSIKHKKLSLHVWWSCFCCLVTIPSPPDKLCAKLETCWKMKENKQFFINDTEKELFQTPTTKKNAQETKKWQNGPLKIVILNDAEDED